MAETPEEKSAREAAERLLRLTKQEAEYREEISNSLDGYIEKVKEYNRIQKTIQSINKAIETIEKNKVGLSGEALRLEEAKLKLLEKEKEEIEVTGKILKTAIVNANTKSKSFLKSISSIVKGFKGLENVVKSSYSNIKDLGLFDMEKAIKKSALSIGVLSKEYGSYRSSIIGAAKQTQMIGVGIEDLTKFQTAFSEELGRSVLLSDKSLTSMGEMVAATGMAAEEAAKLAAQMDIQGLSAERTAKFVEQTMNDSSRMGINSSKVVKNITNNIKMLNKYNFKNGIKGLEKMAMTTTKLGVDMEFASGFADKLFDVEGAVDMSAQLQVMGGAWSQMADPFHLMYMARNDMAGLTEEIGRAAEMSVSFNKRTGQFDVAAKEMHKLRIIAEQTGIAYEDLVTAGKNAKKFSMIKTQFNFSVGGGEDGKMLKEYLTNKSFINEKGEATIYVDGKEKLLKALNQTDINRLKAQSKEEATLRERAEKARTFDDALSNLVASLKLTLLPIVVELNKPGGVITKIDKFVKSLFEKGGFGETIEKFAKSVGEIVGGIANFVAENPKLTAAFLGFNAIAPLAMGAISAIGSMLSPVFWFMKGQALGAGFNSVTGGAGGVGSLMNNIGGKGFGLRNAGAMGRMGLSPMGKFGTNFSGALGSAGAISAGVLSGLIGGAFEYSEQKEKGKSTTESIGRGLLKGLGAGGGAYGGAAAGAALGAFGGPLAPVTVPLGALIGSLAGGYIGGELTDLDNYGVKDGIFESKTSNGYMKSRRAVLQNGKITPIDNKDDLIAYKPNGVIDKAIQPNQTTTTVKHEFEELRINGELRLTSPGMSNAQGVDLLKNPQFVSELTKKINVENLVMKNQKQK